MKHSILIRHFFKFLPVWLLLMTAVSFVSQAIDYYSYKASAPFTTNFSSISNWNTATNGSGSSPIASHLTSGTHRFFIQDGYTVTLDQDISVQALTVGTTTGGFLVIGNSTTARALTVTSGSTGLTINTNSSVTTGAFSATHTLTLSAALTINGTLDLRNSSAQVVNTSLTGTFSILGSGPVAQFNNLTFTSGTVTAARAIEVRGNIVVTGTFVSGAFTHQLFGNWSQTGTHTSGGATIDFANNLVQTISTNSVFNNISFSGGGTSTVSGNLTVNGNLTVTGNSTVTTPNTHTILGNFTVGVGSQFSATGGTITFSGATTQTIDIGTQATFNILVFSNGGSGNPKVIVGNLSVNSTTTINGAGALAHLIGSGSHTFRNSITQNGTSAFSGTVTITAGTLQDTDNDAFNFGAAAVNLTGAVVLAAGDAFTVNNNFTIATGGTFTINSGSSLVDGLGTGTFSMAGTAALFVRGSNNFPSNFAVVSLASTTSQRYDAALPQTVKGNITYGALFVANNTKTVDGPITITGNLDLNTTVTLDLANFSHTFSGTTIVNSATRNGTITSASGGTFTLDGVDVNQIVNTAGSGSYTFHNLVIAQTSTPTAVRTRTFQGNATVNGSLTVSNAAGDIVNTLSLVLSTFGLTKGAPAGTLSLGANCIISTTGATNFQATTASFSTVTLNLASTISFAGTNQDLPALTYGNVEISGNGNKTALGALDVNGNFTRTGGNALLIGGANTHTVAGNWNMNSITLFNAVGTTIAFDGGDQSIFLSNFENVVFGGTGTKTLAGNLTITGNLSTTGSPAINANTRALTLHGNLAISGGAVFTHTTGSLTLVGNSSIAQTISSTAASALGSVTLQRPNAGVNKTTQLLTNLVVLGNFTFSSAGTTNSNNLDLGGFNLRISGNWVFAGTSSTFSHGGGTLTFDGSGNQNIQNAIAGPTYNNMTFAGGGTKTLQSNAFTLDGDFTISGPTVTTAVNINIAGDWVNAGSFSGTGASLVNFNGSGPQNIGGSSFQSVTIAGTNTKTLTGNITLAGNLLISSGSTLDVSASNYSLTVDNNFTISAGGAFTPRNGTVTITSVSTINTGGTSVGQIFNNLLINVGSGVTATLGSNVRVGNDLTLTSGTLALVTNNLNVGGNYTGNSLFSATTGTLTFDASSGTKTFKPGVSSYGAVAINASGAVIQLVEDLTLAATRTLTITAGTIDLEGKAINMAGNVTVNGGVLLIDAGASLRMSNTNVVTVSSGDFRLVGSSTNVANLTLNGSSGNYTYTQTGGSFHALNYRITNTSGAGIAISGTGTIDATNNLSNGTFSSGVGTSYLTLNGITFSSYTASGIVFNAGPTSNITRGSGIGKLTVDDALGALAGNGFRGVGTTNAFVEFTIPAGAITWDGGAGTTSWNDANNWSNNIVPTASTLVYLNHTTVVGAFTVNLTSTPASIARLVMDAGGGANIALVINGTTLTASGSVVVGASCTLTQTTATDFINLGGNWLQSGTFNEGTSAVRFVGTSGTSTITTLGVADPFNNLTFNASGATYVFGSAIKVNGTYTQSNGTVDVSTNNLNVASHWSVTGGTFTPRIATVTFDGNTAQNIAGGSFFNLSTSATSASTKTITSSLTIAGAVTIGVNTVLNGGTQILNVAGNWTNNVGTSGFTQTGTGSVFFNGGNQTIGSGGLATTFRNIYFNGAGNKTIAQNININGDASVLAGVNQVDQNVGVAVTGTGSGTFSMTGGVYRTFGVFPASFGSYSLTAGTVTYISDVAQNIAAVNYFNLNLARATTGTQTKTALGNIAVAGTLTVVDATTTLAMGTNNLTVTGNYVHFAGAPQISWSGTGTFIHDGAAWTISANVTGFNNLTLSGSGVKTMASNLNITGDVQVNSGVTLTMGTFTMTGTGSKSFTLNDLGIVNCGVVAPATAIPASFGSYSFGSNSTYRINGSAAQSISNLPTYGNFDISTTGGAATLLGNTTFNGLFTMTGGSPTLADGGFNMTFGGASVSLRNYIPTAVTTVTFNGGNQVIINSSPGAPDVNFHNLTLSNTGIKTATTSDLNIAGNLTIASGITLNTSRDITLSGALANTGTISHSANTFTFNGTSAQALDPGNNSFAAVYFSGAGAKTFSTNGMTVGNGQFVIENTTVDLGSLTHNIASASVSFVGTGNWTTSNANLAFNRAGAQTIPAFVAQNVTFSGSGTKTLSAAIGTNDLNINAPVTLDVDNTNNFTITATGSFNNPSATFLPRTGLLAFESNSGSAQVINTATLNDVTFNQTLSSTRTYTLSTNTAIQNNLTIGNGATLNLGTRNLTLGTNTAASTITVQTGGNLLVNDNAQLLFNTTVGNATVNASGTFRVVGTSGNVATVSRVAGANRIAINILSGGTIHSRFYQYSNLADLGLDIDAGATVDNTNNFSDGTFSGINTSNTGGPFRYINFNSNTTPSTTINNVTFNHGGTPVIGQHFNVGRASGASLITFAGVINGLLAGSTYEDDLGNKVDWPPITAATWTGATNTDWFTTTNWSTGVLPTATTNVTIPIVANNPEIASTGATCRDLTVTNGILQLLGGNNLVIAGSANIGTGASTGTLVVETSASTITCGGSWTRGTNGVFTASGSTVNFNASTSTFTITPLTSAFGNLTFSGAASFLISGAAINVNGNVTQTAGVVNPTTTNYIWSVGGNWARSVGTFVTSTAGTVTLTGVTQAVTGATFNNLTVAGSGTKTTNGAITIVGNLLLSSATLQAGPGSTLAMQGTVTINSGATFNGGTSTHQFSGLSWTGTGSFAASGSTVNFNRVGGTQTINASKFDGLSTSGTATIAVAGAVDVTGDVTIGSTTNGVTFGAFQLTRLSGPAGTFTVNGSVALTVTGANNFPTGFATYALNATTTTNYAGTSNQTIRGITYGNLTLSNANTKTLGDVASVAGNLTVGTSTLDVSTNNYDLFVGGNFVNNSTGSFLARNGNVNFNGAAAQALTLGTTGTSSFYRFSVSKSGGILTPAGANFTIAENLEVSGGTFTANALTITVGGDLNAFSAGAFANSGTFIMNKSTGSASIQMNGSGVGSLTLSGASTTYTAQDALRVNGNFTISSGVFNANGRAITVGTTGNTLTINGTYTMGAGGSLLLNTNSTVTVGTTGTFTAIGTSGNVCTISRAGVGATYAFNVNGFIAAKHYLFEYMSATGISIAPTATISLTNNFSNGTFNNGTLGAAAMLRIENTQSFTGLNAIMDVKFQSNPGGGARNVIKTSAVSGNLEFYNATGVFSGPTFENDPASLIDWTGPVTMTWNGSVNTDWNTAANWTASSGPASVPTALNDVVIAVASNNPTIVGVNAVANKLTINTGAVLSISSSTSINDDLAVSDNIQIDGFLIMSSVNDRLTIAGNWLRSGSGTFSPGLGIVVMNATSGTKTLNNGSTAFNDLIIASAGRVEIIAATSIARHFTINSGATFDPGATNFALTVGGDFVNNGTFSTRSSLITLNSSATSRTFNPGNSIYFDLTINAGSGAVIYTLTTNSLNTTRNVNITAGRLNLNGLTFNFGNNVGTPSLNLSGTLDVNANATLRLGTGAAINVNSGGVLRLVGTSSSALATITRAIGGTNYAVNINNGGTLHANFYLCDYIGIDGIYLKLGAGLDPTNNLSNGTFSNGTAGGRYLKFENNFGADRTISNIVFNSGASRNVTRITGASVLFFTDASGALGGFAFEEDDLAAGASVGRVRWNYTYVLASWNGSQTGGFWSNPLNWTPNSVPTSTVGVNLTNVGNAPVIDVNATCLNLTNASGAIITLTSNANLTVAGFLNNAGTLTVSGSSTSTIFVGGAWTNTGTFNAGTAGSVTLNAASGTVSITPGASAFRNLTFNSSGSATFSTSASLTVNGDLSLTSGTLLVSNSAHALTIGGSWTQTGGTFGNGLGTVTISNTGAGTQTVTSLASNPFFNLTFTGNRAKELGSNIDVANNLVLNSGSNLSPLGRTINLSKNLTATGATFNAGTSTLAMVGNTPQTITATGGITLNNFTINNSSTSFPQVSLSGGVTLGGSGVLTMTNGKLASTLSSLLTIGASNTISGASSASYISGPIRRTGVTDFTFPIGKGSVYAPMAVESISSSNTFTSEYFDTHHGVSQNGATFTGGLQRVSYAEYWDITRNVGSGTCQIRLNWLNGTRSGIGSAITNLKVVHWNGSQWDNMGGTPTGSTSAGDVVSSVAFTSFSPVTIGSTNQAENPLPVLFSSFGGKPITTGTQLTWTTAVEKDADFFAVEYSRDGKVYEPQGYVQAKGNAVTTSAYAFVHETKDKGVRYYRLKQVDFNGSYIYSDVIAVLLGNNNDLTLSVYPNPLSGTVLNLAVSGLADAEEAEVNVSNLMGQSILTSNLNGSAGGQVTQQLNLPSDMAKGMYLVSVRRGNKTYNQRLVVR